MWCLAVDPQARQPGVGEALVALDRGSLSARGRAFMDLSVLHDNEAIRLYEKLGFERRRCSRSSARTHQRAAVRGTDTTCPAESLRRIIVNEARRRGITVELIDEEQGYFTLSFGGPQHHLPRVAVRADQRDRDEPLRRQAHHPQACWRSRGLRVPGAAPVPACDADDLAFLREHGGSWSSRPAANRAGMAR
jgi:hypothetical protein